MRKDIHGNIVKIGDEVHCWDGTRDQREVTASLKGLVSETKSGSILVGKLPLVLACAAFVEITKPSNEHS